MMQATGSQAHTVRGFLAGVVRKKLGLTLHSEKSDGERVYRLLIAIAKARKRIKDIERGQSFAEIARREERPNGMYAIWHRSSSCRRGSSSPLSTALLRPGSPRRLMAGVAALLILLTMTSVVLGSRRTFQGRATLRISRLRIC
jgi:hypothetical protein